MKRLKPPERKSERWNRLFEVEETVVSSDVTAVDDDDIVVVAR